MKKAISPLISVVLLVGMTVTLIAFIAVWVQNISEETVAFAEEKQEFIKLQDIKIEVLGVVGGVASGEGKPITITISNNDEHVVNSIIFRAYEDERNILNTLEIKNPIEAYQAENIDVNIPAETKLIELVFLVGDRNVPVVYPNKVKVP